MGSSKMAGEKFSLHWNEFGTNVANKFKSLLSDTTFTDVTLVSDDMKQVRAHKLILRSSSNFFRQILQEPTQHQIMFLKGIKYSDLLAIVNFIYLGQTEVAQDDLTGFMDAAATLQVQGLLANRKQSTESDDVKQESFSHISPIPSGSEDKTEDGMDIVNYDHDFLNETPIEPYQFHNYQEPRINFEKSEDNKFACDLCEYRTKYSNNLRTHRAATHEGIKFECEVCNREFSTKTNLRTHQYSKHEGKKYSCNQCRFETGHPTNLSQHKAKFHKYL